MIQGIAEACRADDPSSTPRRVEAEPGHRSARLDQPGEQAAAVPLKDPTTQSALELDDLPRPISPQGERTGEVVGPALNPTGRTPVKAPPQSLITSPGLQTTVGIPAQSNVVELTQAKPRRATRLIPLEIPAPTLSPSQANGTSKLIPTQLDLRPGPGPPRKSAQGVVAQLERRVSITKGAELTRLSIAKRATEATRCVELGKTAARIDRYSEAP